MIILKQIRWKNFLSTGNVFTEINLNSNGTTLIVGENGAGKSTILDALTYALFGKSFRNINKREIKKIYEDLEVLKTLFPATFSCESTDNVKYHCGKCWWCQERHWAFEKL